VEERHQDDVRRAEEEARKQVRAEHPDVAAELFEIKVSDKVKEDEKKRQKQDAAARAAARILAGQGHRPAPPGFVIPPQG
jgi:TRIAD3 protein (E3 ubiquitin-protein ligase RNF216)